MKTLDRSKPFGTVCGEASHRYEQGGLHFDADGNEVSSDTKEPVNTDPVPVQVGDKSYDLAAMDAPALHALAAEMQLTLHPRTGADKVRAAILAAVAKPAQVASPNSGELNAQLAG